MGCGILEFGNGWSGEFTREFPCDDIRQAVAASYSFPLTDLWILSNTSMDKLKEGHFSRRQPSLKQERVHP